MLEFLKKPYPFNDNLKHNAKVIFFISLGVLVFLFMYQPFDISVLGVEDRVKLVFGFAMVIFLALSVNLLVLPSLVPKLFNSARWNIRKEILWNCWLLLTIAFGFLSYTQYMGVMEFSFTLVVRMVIYGILPISVLITVNQARLLRNNLKSAIELNKKLQDKKSKQSIMIEFESDYAKDNLTVPVESLYYIHSVGNYIEIVWHDGQQLQKSMVRSSLKKALLKTEKFKFLFQCHRSYIVNINHIEKIDGNYQGYKVYFVQVENPIPVSQNYITQFKELI